MHANMQDVPPYDERDPEEGTAYTRAIPPLIQYAQGIKDKFSNSPHVTEAVDETIAAADRTDLEPATLGAIAREVFPTSGQTTNVLTWSWLVCAGLFGLILAGTLTLLLRAFTATRRRRSAALAIFLLTLVVTAVAHQMS